MTLTRRLLFHAGQFLVRNTLGRSIPATNVNRARPDRRFPPAAPPAAPADRSYNLPQGPSRSPKPRSRPVRPSIRSSPTSAGSLPVAAALNEYQPKGFLERRVGG